jgi:hypothetical protein
VFFKVSRLSSIDACARFLIASIAALFWSALACAMVRACSSAWICD